MRLEEFDYGLPDERIAQVPVEPRDAARLLVDRGSAPPEHRTVAALAEILRPGDVVVVNETKVLPARLRLRRASGGAAEVLLLEARSPDRRSWEALVRPGRKLKVGEILHATDGPGVISVGERLPTGDTFEVHLLATGDPLATLTEVGEMPLPPYIHTRLADADRYQTVYARQPGSAAAPTAGLHLTPAVIDRLAARGVAIAPVELVVGLDTFQPIAAADPLDHRMHSERYLVPPETWAAVEAAERVVAVGTTSVRALESAAASGSLAGRTELFLHRGRSFEVVDVLMTNFHLPRTTLLVMIDAFVGPRWRNLYATALATGYRFLSFGDAMLLDRHAA
ncbi:MAG: tRNA preQ1(34) S-adenosylmethionine ribosyltransferase-isomerase QueA [Desertimonas sp.]